MVSQRLEGEAISASAGVVIGRVQRLALGHTPIVERRLLEEELQIEQQRLATAVQSALQELDTEHAHLLGLKYQDPILILEAHRMLLLDPELVDKALDLIVSDRINAEWALRRQMDAIVAIFECIEDDYLRSKKSDVEQVGQRIMCHLLGHDILNTTAIGDETTIVITDELSPIGIVSLWRQGIAGVICEQGGVNAHSIIVARGIGLPALVGTSELLDHVQDGDLMVLDAERQHWLVHPNEHEVLEYKRFIVAMDVVRTDLKQYALKESQSCNGRHMDIMANLEFREEVALAQELGVDGVGLFRTEFIFMQEANLPSEAEQFKHYSAIVKDMQGLLVSFRLLDIGGDKQMQFPQLSGLPYKGENPAMGLRGVRMLLQWPEVLKAQIRAILRASVYGPVNILVPMVSNTAEMLAVRAMVDQCCKALAIKKRIAVGCMIEVPAAVMIAEDLAKVSDFFSIGTNDLIQYTLAADRSDENVCGIYSSEHPAILQLIRQTVVAARKAAIPVTVCGELAANPEWTQRFLNLGIHGLSMSLNSTLMIRRHLSKLEYQSEPLVLNT